MIWDVTTACQAIVRGRYDAVRRRQTHPTALLQLVWDWVDLDDLTQLLPGGEVLGVGTKGMVELLHHGTTHSVAGLVPFVAVAAPAEVVAHAIELVDEGEVGIVVELRVPTEECDDVVGNWSVLIDNLPGLRYLRCLLFLCSLGGQ